MINEIIQGSALEKLKTLEADSIDLIVTDPPYGYSFMNKDWDKAVVSTDTWRQCLRVLKPGAFAFIMSSPRQDVFCKMMLNLIEAGFRTDFSSIYWAYASGFPKAADVSKLVDKRNGRTQETYQPFSDYLKQKRLEKKLSMNQIDDKLGTNTAYSWWEGRLSGIQLPSKHYYLQLKQILDLDNRFDELIEREEAEREIITQKPYNNSIHHFLPTANHKERIQLDETKPATEQAKQLEGAYAGFQPKPAVEVILTVMKPLSEKTYVDQALANKKGITWLDDCRIPYQNEQDKDIRPDPEQTTSIDQYHYTNHQRGSGDDKGRFPANLLVEDDVLNDGKITKSHINSFEDERQGQGIFAGGLHKDVNSYDDSGSFSRYFSLDSWSKTLPFLIVPKASKGEKNKGLENNETRKVNDGRDTPIDNPFQRGETPRYNQHPTVKPLKLMSYLITMGSREGDTVLDPFCGSGTVLIAAHELHRQYIGIEISAEYCEIARERLRPHKEQKRIQEFTDA